MGLGSGIPVTGVSAGGSAPRCCPARPGLRLRPRRARLPQALLGRPSRRPRLHEAIARGGSAGVGGGHLQRAQHQSHRFRDHDPQPCLRRVLPTAMSWVANPPPPGSSMPSATTRSSPVSPPPPGSPRARRARGPFHAWGPYRMPPTPELVRSETRSDEPPRVQFPTEFEWMAPSGAKLLTCYMADHYSSGWWMDAAPDLAQAEEETYACYLRLKALASTKNVLLPVGGDYTPPNKWVTEIAHDWNSRYVSPHYVVTTPRRFFAAVHEEVAREGIHLRSQTARHESPLHREGCLVHRYQAGEPPGGERPARRRGLRHHRLARRRPLPHRSHRQGVAATALQRTPRRDHRERVRSGLSRPARWMARGVGAREGGARCRPGAHRSGHRHQRGRSGCGGFQPVRFKPDRSGPYPCRVR